MRDWIFDIDGTLMDGRHREHHLFETPKNWVAYYSKMREDTPIEHMFRIGIALHSLGDRLLCVTGRSEMHRDDTLWQLSHHGFPTLSGLYMRTDGDHRNDNIIKIELLAQLRADGFNPIAVFEDRRRVVDAWREAGLPCLAVAKGEY